MEPTPPPQTDWPVLSHSQWFADEVQQHEAALRGYLQSRFPSVDVDDVVQESYLRVWRARAAGRIASTKAYLFAIARNTATTLFQRRRIYSETPVNNLPDWRVLDGGCDARQALAAAERFEQMSQAIAELPDRCRQVMRLAVEGGCTNAEIAIRLGLAENTVRVHLARGIRKCADFLRARGERP